MLAGWDGQPPSPYAEASTARVEDAQVYLEFAYLRDKWDGFNRLHPDDATACNARKRTFLLDLLRRIPGLEAVVSTELPESPAGFNERFMGLPGRQIAADIASPHHWRVPALFDLAADVAGDQEAQKQPRHVGPVVGLG